MKVRDVLTQPEQIDAATEDGYPYGLAGGEGGRWQEELVCLVQVAERVRQVGRVNGRCTTASSSSNSSRCEPTLGRLAGSRTGG